MEEKRKISEDQEYKYDKRDIKENKIIPGHPIRDEHTHKGKQNKTKNTQ